MGPRTLLEPVRASATALICLAFPRVALTATLIAAALLSACGGGGGTTVASECRRGLVTGFGGPIADATLNLVDYQEGQGGGDGEGGDGEAGIGGGEGIGLGGSDGQYTNVDVTVKLINGETFGPWQVDDVNGMVTYVHCGGVLPAKIAFAGKSADARYYDEGLQRDVSFAGKSRIGLITSYEKNVGVTAFSHALYERAQTIGRAQGREDGWKDLAIIEQAHRELLRTINDQLPGFYRLDDLRRLPVPLNRSNDQPGSGALTANQNGIYGAIVAGLNLAGATALPGSAEPALEMAETVIADLADGEFDSTDAAGQTTNEVGSTLYHFDSLWSSLTTGTGETAVRNGRDSLATNVVPIGFVRSRAPEGSAGNVTETEFVLASNGRLIANLNPSVNGGQPTRPGQDRTFSQLYRFGVEPVVALRRDGQGLLVFPTSWDGSFSFEVAPPSPGVRMLDLIDAGFPVIRMSDGSLYRLQGRTLSPESTPNGILSYTCRAEFDGALANAGDTRLGGANGRVCYGINVQNQTVVWRPGTGASGVPLGGPAIKQVSGNEQISLALRIDGSLLHLDHDHSVVLLDASGNPVPSPQPGGRRELVAPGSAPLLLQTPRICWASAPFVIDCEGVAYALEYDEYLDEQGNFIGAGPITGLRRLAIPAPVWRTRSNQKVTAGDVRLGNDAVFIGTDNRIYQEDGQPLLLPVDGTPVQPEDQPPPAPTVAVVAGDDTISRTEAAQPLIVNGLAQPASTVTATLAGQQQQTTSDGSGRWSVTFPPSQIPQSDGQAVLEVVAANGNGESVATTRVLTINLSLPARPSIDAVTGDNQITRAEAAAGVSISGTATAGATLQLDWSGKRKSTTVDPNGRWSVSFAPGEIPQPGTTGITVTPSNLNGTGESATLQVTVLPPAPSIQIASVSGDNIVTGQEAQSDVQVTGQATAGASVQVDWAGTRKTTTAAANGNWSVSYSSNELPSPGRSTVSAVASNAGGSSAPAQVSVEVQAPPPPRPATPTIQPVTGDNTVSSQEASDDINVTGTATPGISLLVRWEQIEKRTSADSSGNWLVSFTPNEVPSPGTTTVTAQASSSAGTSDIAAVTVEVENPFTASGPTIDPVTGDDIVTAQEVFVRGTYRLVVSGTAEPSQPVIRVFVSNGRDNEQVNARADSSGRWSAAITRPEVFSRDSPGSVSVDYGPGTPGVLRRFEFRGFTLL